MARISGIVYSSDTEPLPQGATVSLYFKHLESDLIYLKSEDLTFTGTFQSFYPEDIVAPESWSVALPGFWKRSGLLKRDATDFEVTIDRIPPPDPRTPHFGWWHRALGLVRYDPTLGLGISAGVIDSGCCRDHSNLEHVEHLGRMVYGEIEDSITYYSDHGTHVCGIVGARPASGAGTEMAGIAPGARLFSLQLNFSSPEEPNDQNLLLGDFLPQHTVRWSNLDIADAIYHLAQECEVNLINLSMTNAPGEERDSEAIHDAIRDVAELGTLCVAAAGNQGTPALAFPAAYREVVSVASLGKRGCGPQWDPNPQLPEYESQIADPFYLAKTSNRGEGLSCCAPGVRIISTVSVSNTYGLRPYLDMTGTSMAAPMVTGALAARLSQKGSAYTRLRGPERTQYARNLLPEICQNLGLARNLQGHGMVSAQKNEVASRILRC